MNGPALLRMGWPRERVDSDRFRAALTLVGDGYTVDAADRRAADDAQRIVARWVMDDPTWRRPDDNGTIAAIAPDGEVAGALMLTAWESPNHGLVVTLRALAVVPEHRGRGLGLVLMGMIPQYVELHVGREPDCTHGSCAPSAARFYQRTGCVVLKPGERLPFRTVELVNVDERYPCHIFRDW